MSVVTFKNVSKKRKDFTIENLNFTIPKGFITGFIGSNGSGKTTTIQMMMDILQIDEGEISLFGMSHKNHEVKQQIGFVYDDLYMYEEFTIKNMKAIIAPLYDNWNEKLFKKYLHEFDLPMKKKIKQFSKGMKMKCSLLFALAHEPEFIIMDEPTAGLDPIFRREFLHILQHLMVREEQTIFISTHLTTDLDQIADYIILLDNGKVIFENSMEDIRDTYHIVKGKKELLDDDIRKIFIGLVETDAGFQALFSGDPLLFDDFEEDVVIESATMEDLMYFLIKGQKR